MRIIFSLFFFFTSYTMMAQTNYLLVGTYTSKGSEGIYVYRFDEKTGKATWVSNTEGVKNPSYLAVTKNGKCVFAVNETNGKEPGMVSAYSFNKKNGQLYLLNQQLSGGDDPCYVAIAKNDKWLTVGNYSGGNFSILKVNKNGSLAPAMQTIQHSGKSVNNNRQKTAHVHATVFSPDENYLFVPDLGMDKIMIYNFDPSAKEPIHAAAPAFEQSSPGNGPRHFIFHPNKKFAYLAEEMSGTVAVYKYEKGQLQFIERLPTHTESFKGNIGSADIHTSPDGKFLYVSNRGDQNSISIFSIDKKTGKLTAVGEQSTLGQTPRNFMIDDRGNFLLVANQNSDNIIIFKRNKQTGLLQDTGERINVSSPVCIKMIR